MKRKKIIIISIIALLLILITLLIYNTFNGTKTNKYIINSKEDALKKININYSEVINYGELEFDSLVDDIYIFKFYYEKELRGTFKVDRKTGNITPNYYMNTIGGQYKGKK